MKSKLIKVILILILIGINLTLILSPGTSDVKNWQNIVSLINQKRTSELFPGCLNYDCGVFYPLTYPPGHFLVIFFFTKILSIAQIGTLLTIKIAILTFYILTLFSFIIFNKFLSSRRNSNKKLKTIDLSLIYLSSLSLILNTQGLGYTDIFFFPFLIFSILSLLRQRYLIAGILFGIASLIKWQPVIILPFLIFYLISLKSKVSTLKKLTLFLVGLFLTVFFLYPLNNNIVNALIFSLHKGAISNIFLSAALNFQWLATYLYRLLFPQIFGPFINGKIDYVTQRGFPFPPIFFFPKLFFVGIYMLILGNYFLRRKDGNINSLLKSSFAAYTSYFMVSSGVHENHLSISLLLALLIFVIEPSLKNRIILLGIDLVNFVNMFIFYGITGKPLFSRVILELDISLFLAFLFCVLYIVLLSNYFSLSSFSPKQTTEEPKGREV